MPSKIKVYRIKDFIRMTESGLLDLDRSISIIRELATEANYLKNHNILLDLRETDIHASLRDLIEISLEFARHYKVFQNKIAVLIPNTEDRLQIANRLKTCMQMQGFEFNQFFDFEEAIEWLAG
jgi:hypothetical protein